MPQIIISDLNPIIDQVSKDKNIEKHLVVEALEQAFLAIAKKNLGQGYELESHFISETGEIEVFMFKDVVEDVKNPKTEISLDEAVNSDPDAIIGDTLGLVVKNIYGRIEAQVAKQIISQKIKEIEHKNIYNEFNDRRGEIISGLVRKVEKSMIIVDLGKTEAVLPRQEQIFSETYRPHDRIRAVLSNIKMEKGGPKLVLSRASDEFLTKLFETEVPEIYDGTVKIVRVARAPGFRSKIAVATTNKDIDPVGACVGMRGIRIQSITNELRGEKIDIIPYSDNQAKFAVSALSSVEVSNITIDEDSKTITVIVPDDQLALAIGKQGQNVRLASKLIGYKLDILSQSKIGSKDKNAYKELLEIPGVGDITAKLLYQNGYVSIESIAGAGADKLAKDITVDNKKAEKIINSAIEYLEKIKADLELKEKIEQDTI